MTKSIFGWSRRPHWRMDDSEHIGKFVLTV